VERAGRLRRVGALEAEEHSGVRRATAGRNRCGFPGAEAVSVAGWSWHQQTGRSRADGDPLEIRKAR
jgi:hypothetical protein